MKNPLFFAVNVIWDHLSSNIPPSLRLTLIDRKLSMLPPLSILIICNERDFSTNFSMPQKMSKLVFFGHPTYRCVCSFGHLQWFYQKRNHSMWEVFCMMLCIHESMKGKKPDFYEVWSLWWSCIGLKNGGLSTDPLNSYLDENYFWSQDRI